MSVGVIVKEILDNHGISYKTNSKSFVLNCPLCNKRDKLYIRKTDGRFVCWVCKESDGFSGNAEWALRELTGSSVKELQALLYGKDKVPASLLLDIKLFDFFDEDDEIPLFVEELPEVDYSPDFRDLDSKYGMLGAQYLLSRGIPTVLAIQYGIKYWPAQSCIVFPVISKGNLLGWQTRTIKPTEYYDTELDVMVKTYKAMTSVGLKKHLTLMFGDSIKSEHVVLCEGPIDAIKAHLCGGNICTMGKIVSHQQLNIIKNSGAKKLYIALDPDAFLESAGVLQEMGDDFEIYDMRPTEEDLGSLGFEQVLELFKKAPRIDKTYLFLYLRENYGFSGNGS